MTETPTPIVSDDVGALVKALQESQPPAEHPDWDKVWVQNLRGFIRGEFSADYGTWRATFLEHFDALVQNAGQAAAALQRLSAERDEAVRLRNDWFKHWRTIIDGVLGNRPMCRDCADNNGTCPNRDGLPCEPSAEVVELFRRADSALSASNAEAEALRTALGELTSRAYFENDRGIGWRIGERDGESNSDLIRRARELVLAAPHTGGTE